MNNNFFKYQNTDKINSYLSALIDNKKKITFLKNNDGIFIRTSKIEAEELNNSYNKQILINFLDLLSYFSYAKAIISYKENAPIYLICKGEQDDILKNYYQTSGKYYLYNPNYNKELRDILKKISSYGDYNFSNELTYNTLDIDKLFLTKDNKIVIKQINNKRLLLIDKNNVIYKIDNKDIFLRVKFPEALKIYINNNEKIKIIKRDDLLNKTYININNNFYLLGFSPDYVDSILSYLNNLIKSKNYKLEMNDNYYLEEDYNYSYQIPSYSRGYINILLISLLITIASVIITLMNI